MCHNTAHKYGYLRMVRVRLELLWMRELNVAKRQVVGAGGQVQGRGCMVQGQGVGVGVEERVQATGSGCRRHSESPLTDSPQNCGPKLCPKL